MKIRTGFVSNSSSSSFLVIIPGFIWNDLIAEATPYEKHIVEQLFENNKFDGRNVKIFHGEVGTDCDSWIMCIDEHESEEKKDEHWKLYEKREKAFYDFVYRAEEKWKDVVLVDSRC